MQNLQKIFFNYLVVFFIFFLLLNFTESKQGQCTLNDEQFLITFHPHLDAFWLNTDDELKNINFRPAGFLYSMNQRNSKQIFNSMLEALTKNQTRKYFITEIVFFKDWYQYIPAAQKQQVKTLLKNGQLDIANSGWVQNDQAVCYYDDILQQYTIGMNWMYEQFGYVNKIGWATDSFGHSHSQVALQHLLGFQFQGIQRIDDRYIYQRKDHPLLEFYWQPVSDSNGKKYGGVLNHVRHFLHEVNDLRRVPSNTISYDFRQIQKNMKKLYNKNKFFRFLGNDFEQFVTEQFINLQKSIQQLNKNNKGCNTYKYGNPKDYVNLVKPYWKNNKLQRRKFDFMTNWDQDRYWSGYFTTDPQLKIMCKQFSRLINLVRKKIVKQNILNNNIVHQYSKVLQTAQQLVSILQHHDGITATSKAHIQNLFKERMKNSSKQLIDSIKKLQNIQNNVQTCQLYRNKNQCKINNKNEKLIFTVLHEGIKKRQKIQLILPNDWIYQVQGINSHLNQNPQKTQIKLIFQAQLNPGSNQFILKGIQKNQFKGKINNYKNNITTFQEQGISINLQGNYINYKFGQNFMKFSFQTSTNSASKRQTMAWNKYGHKQDKSQGVIPGIYIMSNNGQLRQLNTQIKKFDAITFGDYYRFNLKSLNNKINIEITIKKQNPTNIDYNFKFSPFDHNMVDYFLKIQTNIKSENEQFYHDSNGYLVSKRRIGYRPDYDWQYKAQDKINANIYPACSFFYQVNDKAQKMTVFLDRALGVTTYDGSMLINIDRLAQDDYKGVGQSYTFIRQNNFNFKFAITGKNDDIQRIWQRSYDDSLLGFITNQPTNNLKKQSSQKNIQIIPSLQHSNQYLKYSLSFLNSKQLLLRLHNLGQRSNIKLQHYKQNEWNINDINLKVKYKQIKQSFANGLILKQRHQWINDIQEINNINHGKIDTKDYIVLLPLEIRSFRINLRDKIVDKQITSVITSQAQQQIQQIKIIDQKVLIKHSLRKRCFQ